MSDLLRAPEDMIREQQETDMIDELRRDEFDQLETVRLILLAFEAPHA